MTNLNNNSNIYADLAQAAYKDRPIQFPYSSTKWNDEQKEAFNNKESAPFDFKEGGIVYLQPDPTLKVTDKTMTTQVPKMNGGYETQTHITGEKQKGLLTDSEAGFNAYFVTDTPKLNKETKQTYLAIRGSDAIGLDTLNDWIGNDANFALTNSYIPQAKLANQALVSKIKEINEQAPNAKLNVTGHSLGTMIAAQAVAKLYQDDPKAFETIGEVVLFDGPDVTQSLKNMGLTDKEIKESGKKVTYYVNPFDIVSMLNRTAPYEEQFGTVYVIVPLNFNTTFESKNSSHDFGEFQIDAQGKPLVATKDFHPEMLEAGTNLANLIQNTIAKVGTLAVGISTTLLVSALSGGIVGLIALGLTAAQAKAIYDEFDKSYKYIIKVAKEKAEEWNEDHMPEYQNRIRSATGAQKIELRAELLQMVAQDAVIKSEKFTTDVKEKLTTAKEKVQKDIVNTQQAVNNVVQYLNYWEVGELLADFDLSHFWNVGIEEETNKATQKYQTEIEQFSTTLLKIAQNIQEVDAQGASGFNDLMNETKVNWG
ncbi:hypothetical protein Hs30E_18340 [Lactococcus hodotermopsidis]|uniref:Fungal lipase-type domain-containing protein n=1 Tax=Pseudolactococcus hodotermopsidis TaxID=2709157 RepID=A0A6A0BF03_9LACT|nr:alpha/beta hydrolase [Lactococcus hodotermopsidis]GFH43283.1 hypothetical protein Hs30E_18340 [Lactococcus hodotermopsidis]